MEPITVVTATVNRPGLRRTCESVQAQTLAPERHIILLQQRMEDPTLNIPKPTRVPIEIHWLPPPQPHIVTALNLVEGLARTPLVAMLDDDCWWENDHLETLAGMMEETAADFVWGSTVGHDAETDAPLWTRDDPTPAFQHLDTNEILFRRENLAKWGGFMLEDHRGVDGRRIERWVRNGAVYAHSSKVTVHYGHRAVPAFP